MYTLISILVINNNIGICSIYLFHVRETLKGLCDEVEGVANGHHIDRLPKHDVITKKNNNDHNHYSNDQSNE